MAKNGVIWISTWDKGVFSCRKTANNPDSLNFTNYVNSAANTNSLSFDITTSIIEDKQGQIWIGTVSGGLNKFDPKTNKFTVFNTDSGMPGNLIYRIQEDDFGNIWTSTDEGLVMLTRKDYLPIHFGKEYGVPGFYFFASCKFRDGSLAFGTIDGNVINFKPKKSPENSLKPAIIDVKLFNSSVEKTQHAIYNKPLYYAKEFNFDYTQSIITFDFTVSIRATTYWRNRELMYEAQRVWWS